MALKPLNEHYSFTTPATIYDEEALTALELAGRTAAKTNEAVRAFNQLETETNEHLTAQDQTIADRTTAQDQAIATMNNVTMPNKVAEKVQDHIDNGDFDRQIDQSLGNLTERVDNLVSNMPEGGTTMDAEVIDARVRVDGRTFENLGNTTRSIDEELQTEKEKTHGVKTLFEHKELLVEWLKGITPPPGCTIENDTLTMSMKGGANVGVATPFFQATGGLIYVRANIDLDRQDSNARCVLYVAESTGTSAGFKKVIDCKNGDYVYVINPSDYDFPINAVWLVNSGGDAELTYTYTITDFIVYNSIMQDNGYKGVNSYEYILENKAEMAEMKKAMSVSITHITDVTELVHPFNNAADVPFYTERDENTNSVTQTGSGNYGVATKTLDVDPSMLLRMSFDIEMDTSISYGVQCYVADNTGLIFEAFKQITESGHYEVSVDPAYYPVYTKVEKVEKLMIINNGASIPVTTTISNVKVWQNRMEDAGLPNNLAEAVLTVNSKIGGQVVEDADDYLISPTGAKYVYQVDDSGIIRAIPVVPSKSLFLGNSLLLGFQEFGMAASEGTKDYYYLINEAIRAKKNDYTATRFQASTWEGLTSIEAKDNYLNNTLLSRLDADLELVVVQLGDNVNTAEKLAVFAESAVDLLSFIRTHCPKARVAWVGAWYQSQIKMDAMIEACKQTGSVFINIWDLAVNENQSAVGNTYTMADGTVNTITNEGVASHPGDAGFKAIANRVLYTLGISDTENYYE